MGMTDEEIRKAKKINLKDNPYLKDKTIPFEYQKKGILMMLKHPRMVLGDDVGLGKTAQAIITFTYLKALKPEFKAIVMTEKIALRQWEHEFDWLTTGLKVKVITAETHPDPTARARALMRFDSDVLVTTYSLVYKYRKYLEAAMGQKFVLFADEPNYFKNYSTILNKEMGELAIKASRAYGLTATIIENRLEEAFSIFKVIYPGLIRSYPYFESNFCIVRGKGRMRRVVGYKNLDVFRGLIQDGFFGRVQDDPEVQQALPEVVIKDVEVVLPRAQSEKVLEAMDRLISMPEGELKQLGLLSGLTMTQQMVNAPETKGFDIPSGKMDALMETLEGSLKGHKVIVFSKFRHQIDLLQKTLTAKSIPIVRITGKESTEERNKSKDTFLNEKSGVDVLLMTRAGSKAVNLQGGGILFFFDLPWSYGLYRQTVGRIKRTGSKFKQVVVFRMLGVLHPEVAKMAGTEKTIDHHTLSVVIGKKQLFDAITGDETEILTSENELKDIYLAIKEGKRGKV